MQLFPLIALQRYTLIMKIQSIIYKFLTVYSILVVMALVNSPLRAQEPASLERADSLFTEQRYAQAYKEYEKILETGQASPAMLLRMAYIQESRSNESQVLYLLNLYYRQTGDKDVLQKIETLAKDKNLKGYEYSDREYVLGSVKQYREEIIMGLMALSGLLFLFILFRKFRMGQKPLWSGIALILLLGGLFYFANNPVSSPKAIIARDYVHLMSGPSAGSSVVEVIGKGHRLKVLGREDVWFKVEWDNKVLYVKETAVRKV